MNRYKRIKRTGETINLNSEIKLSTGIEDEYDSIHRLIEKREDERYESYQKKLVESSCRSSKKESNFDDVDDEALIMRVLKSGEADKYGF